MGETEFGQRLRRAREAAGLTLADVVFTIRKDFPRPAWTSESKLSRWETKGDEAKADWLFVSVLAQIYRVPTAQLSQRAAETLAEVRGLVPEFRWMLADLANQNHGTLQALSQ